MLGRAGRPLAAGRSQLPEEDGMSAQLDIANLLYRSARGFDDGDIDLLMDTFTADADLVSFEGTTSGRDAIRAALTARREAGGADGAQPRHSITQVEADVESDVAATSRSSFVLFSTKATGITVVSTGVYADRLVNEAGKWLIARRHVQVDHPHPGS
jgi:3-phenylpropionate/cinnamic acid dioxygenase small subunit